MLFSTGEKWVNTTGRMPTKPAIWRCTQPPLARLEGGAAQKRAVEQALGFRGKAAPPHGQDKDQMLGPRDVIEST